MNKEELRDWIGNKRHSCLQARDIINSNQYKDISDKETLAMIQSRLALLDDLEVENER